MKRELSTNCNNCSTSILNNTNKSVRKAKKHQPSAAARQIDSLICDRRQWYLATSLIATDIVLVIIWGRCKEEIIRNIIKDLTSLILLTLSNRISGREDYFLEVTFKPKCYVVELTQYTLRMHFIPFTGPITSQSRLYINGASQTVFWYFQISVICLLVLPWL